MSVQVAEMPIVRSFKCERTIWMFGVNLLIRFGFGMDRSDTEVVLVLVDGGDDGCC